MRSVIHDETLGARDRCGACRGPLAQLGTGRPRRFCSGACRSAAHRRRRERLSESLPRWAAARGRLSLRGARTWRARGAALSRRRDRRRRARTQIAAQRRAWRQWRSACGALRRLKRFAVTSATWPAINSACRDVAEAAARCRGLEVSGADWGAELWGAIQAANLASVHFR